MCILYRFGFVCLFLIQCFSHVSSYATQISNELYNSTDYDLFGETIFCKEPDSVYEVIIVTADTIVPNKNESTHTPQILPELFNINEEPIKKINVNESVTDKRAFGVEADYYIDTLHDPIDRSTAKPSLALNSLQIEYEEDHQHDFSISDRKYAHVLKKFYTSKKGGIYRLSSWRFHQVVQEAWNKKAILFEQAQYDTLTNTYKVLVNFYKTKYWASFGKAYLHYRTNPDNNKQEHTYTFTGFSDFWDITPSPWGNRSIFSEAVTRWFYWRLKGSNFHVSYP
jgi:hypothetical protein